MSITPGGVHDEGARIGTDSLSESLGALLNDDVTPSDSARLRGVQGRPSRVFPVRELGNDKLSPETRLSDLSLDGTAVDREISEVSKQFLGTVLALYELEKIGSIVDELSHELVNITNFAKEDIY